MSYTAELQLVTSWLNQSGLRMDSPIAVAGGVSRGYDLQERAHQYLYLEITGYALSWLTASARWSGEDAVLSLARESLDFLVRYQVPSENAPFAGSFPHHVDRQTGAVSPLYYSFDVAMVLQGLMDWHARSPSQPLLDAAVRAGDWLVERMQQDDGSFLAVAADGLDLSREREDPLFGDGCCLHAKHAIGLLKLWRATGSERYRLAAQNVLDWVLTLQGPSGAIRASVRTNQTVSHTHCYATEGLLYAYAQLKERKYLLAAQKAAAWLARVQGKDGAIFIAYNRSLRELKSRVVELAFPRKVGDATSQAVRIWALLNALEPSASFAASARKAGEFLRSLQISETTDPAARGGLPYWPGHPILFAWVGMFACQAFHILDILEQPGLLPPALDELF